ncbi:MAG: hypothetical protein Q6364_05290, partial [Candidatus Hermodarchaeota archaeon]|nr:hypothetical protein [Candidatus Hermodarchaeota archaeon]
TIVTAYIQLLSQRLMQPNDEIYSIARRIKKETGYEGNLTTMYGWIKYNKVPRDVKLALSEGYSIKQNLLDSYPHLHKYRPKGSK